MDTEKSTNRKAIIEHEAVQGVVLTDIHVLLHIMYMYRSMYLLTGKGRPLMGHVYLMMSLFVILNSKDLEW